MRWLPSWMRRVVVIIGTPCLVASFMLFGAVVFQTLLYLYYGQPLFDNTALPGYEAIGRWAGSPPIVRWPVELVTRAWHMWSVVAPKAITVFVLGTCAGWGWVIVARHRARRQALAHLDKALDSRSV